VADQAQALLATWQAIRRRVSIGRATASYMSTMTLWKRSFLLAFLLPFSSLHSAQEHVRPHGCRGKPLTACPPPPYRSLPTLASSSASA
jgi:hypothetical protein